METHSKDKLKVVLLSFTLLAVILFLSSGFSVHYIKQNTAITSIKGFGVIINNSNILIQNNSQTTSSESTLFLSPGYKQYFYIGMENNGICAVGSVPKFTGFEYTTNSGTNTTYPTYNIIEDYNIVPSCGNTDGNALIMLNNTNLSTTFQNQTKAYFFSNVYAQQTGIATNIIFTNKTSLSDSKSYLQGSFQKGQKFIFIGNSNPFSTAIANCTSIASVSGHMAEYCTALATTNFNLSVGSTNYQETLFLVQQQQTVTFSSSFSYVGDSCSMLYALDPTVIYNGSVLPTQAIYATFYRHPTSENVGTLYSALNISKDNSVLEFPFNTNNTDPVLTASIKNFTIPNLDFLGSSNNFLSWSGNFSSLYIHNQVWKPFTVEKGYMEYQVALPNYITGDPYGPSITSANLSEPAGDVLLFSYSPFFNDPNIATLPLKVTSTNSSEVYNISTNFTLTVMPYQEIQNISQIKIENFSIALKELNSNSTVRYTAIYYGGRKISLSNESVIYLNASSLNQANGGFIYAHFSNVTISFLVNTSKQSGSSLVEASLEPYTYVMDYQYDSFDTFEAQLPINPPSSFRLNFSSGSSYILDQTNLKSYLELEASESGGSYSLNQTQLYWSFASQTMDTINFKSALNGYLWTPNTIIEYNGINYTAGSNGYISIHVESPKTANLSSIIDFKAFYKYNLEEISQTDYYQVPVFNPCYPINNYYEEITSNVEPNGTIVTTINQTGGNYSGGNLHNPTGLPPPSVVGITGSSLENSLIAWAAYIGTLFAMGIALFFFGVDKKSKKENNSVIIMTTVMGMLALSAEYIFKLLQPIVWLYYLTLFLVVLGMVLMFVLGGRHGN